MNTVQVYILLIELIGAYLIDKRYLALYLAMMMITILLFFFFI